MILDVSSEFGAQRLIHAEPRCHRLDVVTKRRRYHDDRAAVVPVLLESVHHRGSKGSIKDPAGMGDPLVTEFGFRQARERRADQLSLEVLSPGDAGPWAMSNGTPNRLWNSPCPPTRIRKGRNVSCLVSVPSKSNSA